MNCRGQYLLFEIDPGSPHRERPFTRGMNPQGEVAPVRIAEADMDAVVLVAPPVAVDSLDAIRGTDVEDD